VPLVQPCADMRGGQFDSAGAVSRPMDGRVVATMASEFGGVDSDTRHQWPRFVEPGRPTMEA